MSATTDRARRALPWLALLGVLVVVLVVVVTRSAPDDSDAARANRLARELRCPVCQGLSVADSFEPTSEAIKSDIAERIDDGQSDGEIRQAYVDRYGESILLRPEGGGLGVLAWGLPVAVLVLGAAGVVFALRRWSRDPERTATPSTARRWVTVGGLVGFAVVAAFVAAEVAGERRPGQAATGNDASATPSAEEREAALRAAVDATPQSYNARIALARFLLNNDLAGALREYDAAAEIDPTQPEPAAYGGWVLGLVARQAEDADREQLVSGALARLDRAADVDPDYPDTFVFRGLILYTVLDDPAAAVPEFQRFLATAPDEHPQRALVVDTLARAVDELPTTTAPISPTTTTTQEP
ncbi:MAG TPA: cytochrome c-type biogenesis protein CcmH [Acidimicrobiia bacterium]|nr:cytochrome c-type biogenesis protein CcmH [Acidimicrobiia bacterium]